MEMYAVRYPSGGYDFPISTLFWGAVIVVALVAACLLVKRASESPYDRRHFDDAGRPANQQRVPPTLAETTADQFRRHSHPDPEDDALIDSQLDKGWGFSKREEEEFLLIHGPRTVRKAIRERRNARKQARKKQGQP
jgi:hypothetical protein